MVRYITWGKYKGHTIEELMTKNPQYLVWAVKEGKTQIMSLLNQKEIAHLKTLIDNKTQLQITCINKGVDTLTNKHRIQFNITGLNKTDAYQIITKLHNQPNLNTKSCSLKLNVLQLIIYKEDFDKWCDTGLKELQNILINSGNYDTDEIEHLADEFYAKFGNSFNTFDRMKEYKDTKNQAIEIWKDYLKRLDDPDVRKQIEMFSALPIGNKKYGHMLSVKNAMLIRSTNANATFILPVSWWRKLNRGVKRGAKRYVIYIPVDNPSPSSVQTVKDVIRELGWGDTPYDELSPQIRRQVDIETNNISAELFRPVYEYDYADTYLFKGAEDIFNETIGLRNNITGELNQLAINDASKGSGIKQSEIMEKRTIEANKFMSYFCQKHNISFKSNENPSINLVNALKAKYTQDAKNIDILRDVNVKTFADNATHITLLMGKYAYNALNLFSHGADYTNKEVSEMINVVSSTISAINNNMQMNESKISINENNFVDEFMKAFKQIGCKIKNNNQENSFNESRLDKIIKENITKHLKKKIYTNKKQ